MTSPNCLWQLSSAWKKMKLLCHKLHRPAWVWGELRTQEMGYQGVPGWGAKTGWSWSPYMCVITLHVCDHPTCAWSPYMCVITLHGRDVFVTLSVVCTVSLNGRCPYTGECEGNQIWREHNIILLKLNNTPEKVYRWYTTESVQVIHYRKCTGDTPQKVYR